MNNQKGSQTQTFKNVEEEKVLVTENDIDILSRSILGRCTKEQIEQLSKVIPVKSDSEKVRILEKSYKEYLVRKAKKNSFSKKGVKKNHVEWC